MRRACSCLGNFTIPEWITWSRCWTRNCFSQQRLSTQHPPLTLWPASGCSRLWGWLEFWTVRAPWMLWVNPTRRCAPYLRFIYLSCILPRLPLESFHETRFYTVQRTLAYSGLHNQIFILDSWTTRIHGQNINNRPRLCEDSHGLFVDAIV